MVGAAKGGLGRFAGKIYVAENHTNHSEGKRLARWARSCSGKGAAIPESARLLVGTASALPNRAKDFRLDWRKDLAAATQTLSYLLRGFLRLAAGADLPLPCRPLRHRPWQDH